eukprot:748539-Hanusia_phi.AAC.1
MAWYVPIRTSKVSLEKTWAVRVPPVHLYYDGYRSIAYTNIRSRRSLHLQAAELRHCPGRRRLHDRIGSVSLRNGCVGGRIARLSSLAPLPCGCLDPHSQLQTLSDQRSLSALLLLPTCLHPVEELHRGVVMDWKSALLVGLALMQVRPNGSFQPQALPLFRARPDTFAAHWSRKPLFHVCNRQRAVVRALGGDTVPDESNLGKLNETYLSMYTLKTKTLKTKKNLHLSRKIFHTTSGVIMASLYEFWLSREVALLLLIPGFFVFFIAESFRVNFPKHPMSILFFRLFARLARSYEIERRSGIVFYLAGVLACVFLFPKPIAVLSILFLAFGDPFASLCGMNWGSLGPRFSNGKSFIGSFGGMVACSLITFLYFLRSLSPSLPLLGASLIGGFAGTPFASREC